MKLPMRAIVIDDTHLGRTLAGGLLKNFGFEITEAQSGEEGLLLLESAGPFDVALVDWNMPGMSGLESSEPPVPLAGTAK